MSGRGGGRGGARGGRGGARKGPPGLPWEIDPSVQVPDRPQETYPKTHNPPPASKHPLTASESRSVRYFVKVRRDFHNSPLYTHKYLAPDSTASAHLSDPVSRSYGQEQINAKYGVKSKAAVDPFTAVPTYSHQFVEESRTLPDVTARPLPYIKEFFPPELWGTIDGHDGPKTKAAATARKGVKRKSIAVEEDPLADSDDEIFAMMRKPETEAQRRRRIEEAAEGGGDNEDVEGDVDVDEEEHEVTEDDDYEDDEDGGDYNAEQYFDNGVDGGDDDDGDGGGEVEF
ncbi:DNA-directed RNA polymerase III, subunit Rpc31 [Pseudomassariella vexata]|uniref:DNA-directed RNA polymerase III subunit n=1 Tax=Pseudomassariella vexata TaxID=1141098 RepID=A0A1Y2DKF9_9PEZI|nr:DNA-directed RNA polymerase III, subunit Rpc31 [Pseudomassariella vexata]ORY59768.1 DNA-directed RNA polymerase III, subunit Rpc31 [Pseudomassariella vexata]